MIWSVSQPASSHAPREDSIHKAYLYAIEHAEHSVYIENQFFISSQGGKVKNQVQEALACRIASAYCNKQNFHVMIILPLLPEGPLKKLCKTRSLTGRLFKTVCYLNYATLYNGEHSLWEKLKKRNVSDEYRDEHVHVYGLRTHDAAKLVTELVYVHSKVMIVDDKLAIIGSANINDRSMLGNRDSEVDVVIEDQEFVSGMVNGNAQLVGKFSHSLRCQLMKEHLGLLEDSSTSIDVRDPVSQHYQNRVSEIASNNTEVYEEVFKCLPTDKVQTKEDLKTWKKTEQGLAHTAPHKARTELAKIQGHIVTFSGKFLVERLKPCVEDKPFKVCAMHAVQPQSTQASISKPGLQSFDQVKIGVVMRPSTGSTILTFGQVNAYATSVSTPPKDSSLSDEDLSDEDLSDEELFDEYDIL